MNVRLAEQIVADAHREGETIRRQAKVIDTLEADRLVHLAFGAIIGGFVVAVCYWQADPLIRALDDIFTAAGWLGTGQ